MKKKTYILDTNVLLFDPQSLFAFEEHDIVIPMVVIEELDHIKTRQDEIGRNARQVSRCLDDMRTSEGCLATGVKLKTGGTLRVLSIDDRTLDELMPVDLDSSSNDNMIIAYLLQLTSRHSAEAFVLVSKDINVRIKCDGLNVRCEDYRKMRVTPNKQAFYKGVTTVKVTNELVDRLYDDLVIDTQEFLNDSELSLNVVHPNQVIVAKAPGTGQTGKTAIVRVSIDGKTLELVKQIDQVFGLRPRNKEQNFSLNLLLDPDVCMLTLVGPSGTGKTLLSLAAAMEQLKRVGKAGVYERIIVTKPVMPVGRDLGFLPGTKEEKMAPWIAPIRDNLNFLMGANARKSRSRKKREDDPYLGMLQESGLIEIEAITYIRGRSIPNSFIVIDEAQNLSMHELKTIITRVGEGTKIVLTGDIEQIDNLNVDVYTNGLTYAVEKFKEHDVAGHVTLIKGERSRLATLASKIL